MKKSIICLLLYMLASAGLNAGIKKNHVELTYGISNIRMTAYNDHIEAIKIAYKAADIQSDYHGMVFGQTPSFYWVVTIDGGFAIVARADYMAAGESRNTVYNLDGKTPALKEQVSFNSVYTGAGLRKYLRPYVETEKIGGFAGIDAGFFTAAGASYKIEEFDGTGVRVDAKETGLTGTFFCFNAEAGADYWFNATFGAVAKAGIRFASGRLSGATDFEIDFGGLYASAGICVSPF